MCVCVCVCVCVCDTPKFNIMFFNYFQSDVMLCLTSKYFVFDLPDNLHG